MTWETKRDLVGPAVDHVRAHLVNGYEDLAPSGARMTEMTPPPGVDDRF
jgi:hypothetical protein